MEWIGEKVLIVPFFGLERGVGRGERGEGRGEEVVIVEIGVEMNAVIGYSLLDLIYSSIG